MQHTVQRIEKKLIPDRIPQFFGAAAGLRNAYDHLAGEHPAAPIQLQRKGQNIRWLADPQESRVEPGDLPVSHERYRELSETRSQQHVRRHEISLEILVVCTAAGKMERKLGATAAHAVFACAAAPSCPVIEIVEG